MSIRKKRTAKAVALAAAATLLFAGCSTSTDGGDNGASANGDGPLKVGFFLPMTGSVAFVTPGPIAGLHHAISEIDAAGGVLGQPVEIVIQTSEGDAADTSIADKGVAEILASDTEMLIGPLTSSIGMHSATTFGDAGLLTISPSATTPGLTGISPLYFRTLVSDEVQAGVIASQIIQEGYQNVGIFVQNDDYGVGLRDKFEESFTEQGGQITYGGKGAGQEFPMDQQTFASEVSAIMGANTDAVVIFAFDQTYQIIPELANQGFDLSRLFLVDVNTADYSADFDPGTLEGARGLVPGAQPDPEFLTALEATYEEETGEVLSSTAYMLETYDAMILGALAAERGGATDSATIQANLHAVSGSDGGTPCDNFADCKALLNEGEEIIYEGRAGIGPFNSENDPSTVRTTLQPEPLAFAPMTAITFLSSNTQ